ncbi:MAG: 16S rRNA (guanine(966)-N(2))-methyltransferase RsmD [Clostridia bacterium]|nr:16S rRNA (guanine(966)-N(2))-methyltransferase RsmD [Clostridia bacterium]
MRVITGLARGRKLRTLDGNDVRPTTDLVKESIFSIIQFDIDGRSVLDLFSGCGQLGIEAVSRGAKEAVFVDKSKQSATVTLENIKSVGFEDKCKVFNKDFATFLSGCGQKFDIIFLDPPYSTGLLAEALSKLDNVLKDTSVVICEHPYGEKLPDSVGNLAFYRNYKYGKLAVTVYKRGDIDG